MYNSVAAAVLTHPDTLGVVSGMNSRGSGNTFRYNVIEDNVGAGVRLGGHTIDGYTYGVDNHVYGNTLEDNDFAGIKAVVSIIESHDYTQPSSCRRRRHADLRSSTIGGSR